MVIGLIMLIAVRGLAHFWPAAVIEFDYVARPGDAPVRVIGELSRSETMTAVAMREAGFMVPEDQELVTRHLIKQGNRDVTGRDFVWYLEDGMSEWRYPRDIVQIERLQWGDFFGYLRSYEVDGVVVAQGDDARAQFEEQLAQTSALVTQIGRIERFDIGNVNFRMERIRLRERGLELTVDLDPSRREAITAQLAAERAALEAEHEVLEAQRQALRQ